MHMHMPPQTNSIFNATNTLVHIHLLEFLLEVLQKMEIMEDDLFFADLSKQISLLVMDEDDGDVELSPPWHSPHPLQGMSYVLGNTPTIQGQGQGPRNVQEEKNRRSKGTGVFIPRFTQPRRKRTTPFHHRHHPSRHNSNNNSSRPTYRHQHIDYYYYTPRRFSQEGSKDSYYFINPYKDLI